MGMRLPHLTSNWVSKLGLLCVVALIAAACGGDGTSTTTGAEATSTTATDTTESEGEPGTTTTTGSPDTTAPQELTEVSFRTGFGCDSWDAPWFVARELGFYEEEGLSVEIGCGEGSNSNVQLVATKSETFAHASGSAVASAVAQGGEIVSVASFFQLGGAGIAAQPDIETVEDMVGRVFAGPSFDYVTGFVSPTFENAAGLDVGSITVQNTDSYIPLFLSGDVDMIPSLGWAEVPRFREEGVEFNFYPFADFGLDLIGPGIVTHTDNLEEMPEVVEAFTRASQRGWQYVYDNPEEATEIMVEVVPDVEAEVHRAVIESLEPFAHRPATEGKNLGWMAESDWADALDLMVENDLIDEPIDPTALFENVLPEEP